MNPIARELESIGGSQPIRHDYSPAACLMLAATIAVPLDSTSRVTLFDIVAIVIVLRGWRTSAFMRSGLVTVLALSVAAMAASAYYHQSGINAFLGRAYPPILLSVEAIAYFVLAKNTSEYGRATLVLSTMLGICGHYFYPNDLRVLDEPIKFLMGVPLGVAVVGGYALVPHRTAAHPLPAAMLMAGYALFCFAVGSRSIGGVFFASAASLIPLGRFRLPANYATVAPVFMIAFGVGVYVFTEVYTLLALRGLFGNTAAGIAAFQSSYGSILIGGRPEILVNLIGIRESPLLGAGIGNFPAIYLYDMINLSVYAQETVFDIDNILYHSAVFGTAFESGIVSASFWIFALYRILFAVPLLKDLPADKRAYCLPLLLMSAWHLLYSPPISYNRFVMAIGLALAYVVFSEWKDREAKRGAAPA